MWSSSQGQWDSLGTVRSHVRLGGPQATRHCGAEGEITDSGADLGLTLGSVTAGCAAEANCSPP
jgi:hypothetical protein